MGYPTTPILWVMTSLYEKYGEFAGISSVVHRFYDRVIESDNLEHYFTNVQMDRLIDHQTKFLCKVLGGPDNYTGRGLKAAHKNLKITESAFAEVAEHLRDTLEEAGVEKADIQAILEVVASTKSDIVTIAG